MTRLEKCELAIKKGFTYCEKTGNVTSPTGKICSKKTLNGYIMLTIRDEKSFSYYLYSHHLAWFFKYKEIVPIIDHINRVKTDNRISNLRSVTKSQNAMNMNNVKGVSFCKRSNKWIANIMVNYKKIYLGSFINKEDALNCYKTNKEKYHIIK